MSSFIDVAPENAGHITQCSGQKASIILILNITECSEQQYQDHYHSLCATLKLFNG